MSAFKSESKWAKHLSDSIPQRKKGKEGEECEGEECEAEENLSEKKIDPETNA